MSYSLVILLIVTVVVLSSNIGVDAARQLFANVASNQTKHLPEHLNGIGSIRVFVYGDEDADGQAVLRRMKTMCSSTTVLLTSSTGRGWTWHDKLNRLFPLIRHIPDGDLVLLLDGDTTCFPCPRDLRTEFQRFNAGVVFAGYPWNQETSRFKTAWFPPATLLDRYNKTADAAALANLMELRYLNAGTILATAGALKYYLSQVYLKAGYVDLEKFDDQSEFWANMYLAQVYAPDFLHHRHAEHRYRNRVRMAIDSEGTLFQLAFLQSKGSWVKTPAGHLQRQHHLYQKEVCVMHLVGDKKAIPEFIQNWEDPEKAVVYGDCPTKESDKLEWGCYDCVACKESIEKLQGRRRLLL